jgi:hypothetical protein
MYNTAGTMQGNDCFKAEKATKVKKNKKPE